MSQRPILFNRVARYVTIGYLFCAIAPRLLSSVGVLPLASFYWSLPGALLGSVAYAAWTGLRDRRQSILGLTLSGAAGVLLSGTAILRLPATIRPLPSSAADGVSFFGTAVYGTLCDLSAIVFLFAIAMAAFVPAGRPGFSQVEAPDKTMR